MKIRSEKGFTGIDISISIVIIFIFVSIIAALIAQVNRTAKEVSLKSDATYIAINEIEQVKNDGIEAYIGKSKANGNNIICENEPIENEEGFYKTITVEDYADISDVKEDTDTENTNEGDIESEEIIPDIVKRVTVKISYVFQAKEQSVELSTIVSKES